MTFSIDDARETFTRDIEKAISRIHERSTRLLGALPASPPGEVGFLELGDVFHTIYGTTMLVGASSIANVATELEALCRRGQEELRAADRYHDRARRVAALCVDGAAQFTALLDLELRHRRPEAAIAGVAFQNDEVEPMTRELSEPPDLKQLDPEREFAFADDDLPGSDVAPTSAGSSHGHAADGQRGSLKIEPAAELSTNREVEFSFSEVGDDEMQRELLPIFQHEAREALTVIGEQLGALISNSRDLSALAQMERIFHTLKGAALVIGLLDVGEQCSRLQDRLQTALDSEMEVTTGFIDELFALTNRMLSTAGLEQLRLERPVPVARGVAGDPARLFLLEARQICERALVIERELPRAAVERLRELRRELGQLFHRLKGSALLSTAPAVSEEAARLCAAVETARPFASGEVSRAVARIAATLGMEISAEPLATTAGAVDDGLRRESVHLIADPTLLATVLEECAEVLDAIDKCVLGLETTDRPQPALEELFRHYHTLKGAVNTAGMTPTGRTLHLVEDFLESLKDSSVLPPPRAIATLLLKVQVDVRRQLRQSLQGFVEFSHAELSAAIRSVARGGSLALSLSAKVHPSQDLAGHRNSVRSELSRGEDVAERRYIRVETERLDALMNLAGELVVSRSRLTNRAQLLKKQQQELSRSSHRLVESVDRFRDEHEFSLISAKTGLKLVASSQVQAAHALPDRMASVPLLTSFSELELDRYDDVNVLARSLTELTSDVSEMNVEIMKGLTGFTEDSDAFGTIVSGIQSEITRARMIELGVLFTRVRLQVRDAAERETKQVRVVSRGDDVSLDKTIADALFTPLLHLVRNAVVHGVESPEQRARLGKAAYGTVTLSAREEAGHVAIDVSDDGGGLDLLALRARGAELGLVDASVPLDDPRIKELVFASGLSTKTEVSAVSGRGVGGDVIRRAVERMNGSIDVSSVAGVGTTFTMSLPVTLSITRALVIRQRGRTFAVPLHFSERIVDIEDASIAESAGIRRVQIEGRFLPVRHLDDVLGIAEQGERAGPILVLRMGQQRVCLQVESVGSQEEIVVKGLGDLLSGHPLFAGATIRGNGELALILDVPTLIEGASRVLGTAEARLSLKGGPLPLEPQGVDHAAGAPPVPGERAHLAASRRAEVMPTRAREPARREGRQLRVLFADDSLSVRRVAESALHGLGVEVVLAMDGADALNKLRGGAFDMLFTDLEMPRMHGYDLIRELRFLPAYQQLPVVVVSSRSGAKHREQALALGANEYMTKPFAAKGLQAALTRWCGALGAVGAPAEAGALL